MNKRLSLYNPRWQNYYLRMKEFKTGGFQLDVRKCSLTCKAIQSGMTVLGDGAFFLCLGIPAQDRCSPGRTGQEGAPGPPTVGIRCGPGVCHYHWLRFITYIISFHFNNPMGHILIAVSFTGKSEKFHTKFKKAYFVNY